MPSPDEVIPAALALHNSPRRYALLLGSGISQDAGIPTAGEITEDLIRQTAGEKIKSGQNPEDWYKETHEGRTPTFTSLMSELAKSDEDRSAILRQYFEREGIELTPAHKSIARLVKSGIISMIITTNFDPLLEEAIKKETGKTPVVITHESDPRRMEVSGDHCRIVMVNGRYPTTDLKLTPEDLASYDDDNIADYLDQTFSEYGLLVCGWSGMHDTGLVKILTTDRVRRFATFWCSRDAPEKIPEKIRNNLHISTIGITSANEFFGDLESHIELLRRHERTTLLTVESAVKKVKDALRDPRPELILSDLLHDETDRVLTKVNRSDFVPKGPIVGKAIFRDRIEELEHVSAPLASMVATLAFYTDGEYSDLITEIIDRLINLHVLEDDFLHDGQRISDIRGTDLRKYLHNLRLYPALLVIYSAGIAATRKENFNCLSAILENPCIQPVSYLAYSTKPTPYFERINMWSVIWTVEQWNLEISRDRFGKMDSPYFYLTNVLHYIVKPLIPSEFNYEASFDVFEYLYGLSYIRGSESEISANAYPLLSRVIIQYNRVFGKVTPNAVKLPDPILSLLSSIGKKIERTAFFNGETELFLRCVWKHGIIFQYQAPQTDIPLPRGGFPGL